MSLQRSRQNWHSGSSSRNTQSSRSVVPVSFPNQNLVDPELLKRPSSSSARLYHRPIRKVFPCPIHSHHGQEFLHPRARQPRRRTLLTELDGRRGQCRTRARPGAPSPSLRREWVVHYQWGDVLLVEGRDALEGG